MRMVTQRDQIESVLQGAESPTEIFQNKKGEILITEEIDVGLSRVVIDKRANINFIGCGPVRKKIWQERK